MRLSKRSKNTREIAELGKKISWLMDGMTILLRRGDKSPPNAQGVADERKRIEAALEAAEGGGRPAILQVLKDIEAEQARIDNQWQKVADRLALMDEDGIGVRVQYDYDHGWLVDTLNAGEWEVETSWSTLSEAIEDAERLASNLKVGLHINSYLPPRKYRKRQLEVKDGE